MIEADGLILHLNPLQEALQPEGDVDFRGLADKIAGVKAALGVPLIVKEVGWGLSETAARLLYEAGVDALDVAGAGGTSWSQVEMYRNPDPYRAATAGVFADWGIPTVESLLAVRRPSRPAGVRLGRSAHRGGCGQVPGAGRQPGRVGGAVPEGGERVTGGDGEDDGDDGRPGAHCDVRLRGALLGRADPR
jgi:hypothetical protein